MISGCFIDRYFPPSAEPLLLCSYFFFFFSPRILFIGIAKKISETKLDGGIKPGSHFEFLRRGAINLLVAQEEERGDR